MEVIRRMVFSEWATKTVEISIATLLELIVAKVSLNLPNIIVGHIEYLSGNTLILTRAAQHSAI